MDLRGALFKTLISHEEIVEEGGRGIRRGRKRGRGRGIRRGRGRKRGREKDRVERNDMMM